jgi:hypothetical protein
MDDDLILAATRWPTNAELIEDCARLGYLRKEWRTLDPTYGNGIWWRKWSPERLIINKYIPEENLGYDFCKTPWPGGFFDAIAFDPPYVSVGGRKTTTTPDFHDRFGLTNAPTSPAGVQDLINNGMREMRRILKVKGILLVKCKSYISSGKLWPGVHLTWDWGVNVLGLELVDELTFVGDPGQQSQKRQVHARQNSSTLFVFGKGAA